MVEVHQGSRAALQCPSASAEHWTGLAAQPNNFLARAVLTGMIAQGHGSEALCLFLHLARTALFDLVVELDLPTPHDRPLRKAGGRNPWSVPDTILFIVLWMAGWHAESLGQRFGRSAGSAWAKARQLGLPRRDRKSIFRPAHPGEALPTGALQSPRANPSSASKAQCDHVDVDPPKPILGQLPQAASLLARDVSIPGTAVTLRYPAPSSDDLPGFDDLFGPTPVGLPPRRKIKRQEVPWTRERDIELAQRWWALQHYKAIARDMGITPSAVQSRRFRLGLPSHSEIDPYIIVREALVDHFDPLAASKYQISSGYKERKCNRSLEDGRVFWFWSKHNRTSDEYFRLGRKRDARPARSSPPTRHSPALCFASDPL